MWTINSFGEPSVVIAELSALTFAGMVEGIRRSVETATFLAQSESDARFIARRDQLSQLLTLITERADNEAAFDRMRDYLISEAKSSSATKIGVTGRAHDLGDGRIRFVIDYSEHEV